MKEGKERNLKLTIEYDGTGFFGWQRQKSEPTIQQHLEDAIAKILNEKIVLTGCGRTDAGVHALEYIANFKTRKIIANFSLMMGANSKLPKQIRIKKIEDAPADFHARFSVKSKVYRYRIYNASVSSPHICRFAHFFAPPISVSYIRKAAEIFVGKHDFFSLATSSKLKENTVRTIFNIEIERNREIPELIEITVEGDGFLYNMVRTIAGTLLEVGTGQRTVSSCKQLIEKQDRTLAGPNLPPEGLALVKVNYQ